MRTNHKPPCRSKKRAVTCALALSQSVAAPPPLAVIETKAECDQTHNTLEGTRNHGRKGDGSGGSHQGERDVARDVDRDVTRCSWQDGPILCLRCMVGGSFQQSRSAPLSPLTLCCSAFQQSRSAPSAQPLPWLCAGRHRTHHVKDTPRTIVLEG